MRKRKFTYGGRKLHRSMLTDGCSRLDIVKIVRSIEFTGSTGGLCWWRAMVGSIVLSRFDISHKVARGGLLYRAGLGLYDTIMWAADEDNKGHFPGRCHYWLETDDDLIDFSTGDWRDAFDRHDKTGRPPINWEVPPPKFIWGPKHLRKDPWRPPPYGPSLGCAWYGPMLEPGPETDKLLDKERDETLPMLEECVDRVFIKLGLPVFKVFDSDEERDAYMKENNLTGV